MTLRLSDFDQEDIKPIAPPNSNAGGIGNFAKGVAVGVGKSVGETILGAGQIGRKVQTSVFPNMPQTSPFDPENAQAIRDNVLAPNAPGQGTGKFIGTAAQYMLPTSGIAKGQRILSGAASVVPRGGKTIANAAARFIPEAVGSGAVSYTQSGGDLDKAKTDAALAGGVSVGLGSLGALARATYWPDLDASISKALGIQGKKSGGVALKDTATKVSGLKVLKDRASSLKVKLDDGTEAAFDPSKASYSTTLQAWNKARQDIFNEYTSLTRKVGEKATIDLNPVREQIASALDAPILSVEKNAVQSILRDFDSIFRDPSKVDMETAERFVKSLNDNTVKGLFSGTSDVATSKVNAGTSRIIRDILDNTIEEATGKNYQGIRSQYAALKSLEDDLVRKFQQDARSIGGGLPEYTGAFASGDMLSAALALDPVNFTRGAALSTFAVLKRKLSNPERFLRRSFDLIDQAPSDLTQRLFGTQGRMSADEQAAASKVGASLDDAIKNPQGGMSIRPVGSSGDIPQSSSIQKKSNVDGWNGTPSSKPSTDVNTSISKKPSERGDVSARKTDTSDPFGSISTQAAKMKAEGKTFEEFVKAQGGTYYRGTTRPQEGAIREADTYGLAYGKGVYVTQDKTFAQSYGDYITEMSINLENPFDMSAPAPKSAIAAFKRDFPNDVDMLTDGMTGEDLWSTIANADDANEWLQSLGYDGLKDAAKGTGADQTIIFDVTKIKTRAQLESIWKKSQPPTPSADLVAEARKYKSAEEFVKAQNDPLMEYKQGIGIKDADIARGSVMEAINDIGGVKNVQRGTVGIRDVEVTENINTSTQRYKDVLNAVKNGERAPIVIDEYGAVQDGHHRLEAYREIGLTQIPVIAPKGTEFVRPINRSKLESIWQEANKR